jgi:pyruvate formate lyase activating enzyme
MNAGLVKTSLVNFPGRVAAAVFLPGCNLRCPFCHNAELAIASVVSGPKHAGQEDSEYVTIEEIFAHLEKRKGVLGGLAISGGEPVLSPVLGELVAKARTLGLAVKIDTNGTLTDRLFAILEDPSLCPDMIAIDVKTSPARYAELAAEPTAGERAGAELMRTLSRLSRSGQNYARPVRVEYRTVLVPGLVGESEIREIAALLPAGADWEFAKFVPGTCLDPSWNDIEPYGPAETRRLMSIAQTLCHGAKLR